MSQRWTNFAYDVAKDVEAGDDGTTDDYQLSSDTESGSTDESGFDDDHDALALDGRPTFTVDITPSNFGRTLEIPYGFWYRHIRMAAVRGPVTEERRSMLWLLNSDSKIWVKTGWKRFKRGSGIKVGDRLTFTLVDPDYVTFYVLIDRRG